MPCVCLRNTFKHWQALKVQQLALRQAKLQEIAITPDAAAPTRSSSEVLRVPHPRKPLASSVAHSARPATPLPPPFRFTTKPSRADLINAESRLGSSIFGPIPSGHRREFFHDRENVWIWHEDWQDAERQSHQLTVRYEVRTSGVYKKVTAGQYLKLEGEELANFCRATRAYLYMVKKYLYQKIQLQPTNF